MENYRRHKKNRESLRSVDGFVSRPIVGRRGTRGADGPLYRKTVNRPQFANFNQPDGLHVPAQGTVGFESSKERRPVRDDKGRILLGKKRAARSGTAKPKKRNIKHVMKRVSVSLVAIVLMTGTYMGVKAFLKSRKILAGGGGAIALQENVDPTLLNGEGDGRVNILLLGKGGEGHTAPDLTDTILIASIDPINNEAALVSIPRDTYFQTPDQGSMKINAVYATAKQRVLNGPHIEDREKKAEEAGITAIENAVEKVLGISMNYHVMVDFKGFEKAINAVGGVDIDVPKPVYEVMRIKGKRYVLNVKTGQQHFDGFRALAYSRSRYTSARGDFDRAERQRLILVALKNKVLSLGTLSNPLKVNELINALGDHVQSNFSQGELMRLYEIGQAIDSAKVESIGLADPPNNYLTTGRVGNQSVVLPTAGLNNYKAIHAFIRNKLRDGYLKSENASVLILNGTTLSGLAGRTAEELKSYGYTIQDTDDAPTKNYQHTILVDLRNGEKKYTKHYLEKRFGTTAVTSLPEATIAPGAADFVIILGVNEQSRLQN